MIYLLSLPASLSQRVLRAFYLEIVMHFDFWRLLTKYLQISDWHYLMWLCWSSWQNSPTSSKFSPMMPQLMAQCLGRSNLPLSFPGLSPLLTTAPRDSQTTSWDSITFDKLQRRGNRRSFHPVYGCWIWELTLKVEQDSCLEGLNLDCNISPGNFTSTCRTTILQSCWGASPMACQSTWTPSHWRRTWHNCCRRC